MCFRKAFIALAAALILLSTDRVDACSCAGWPSPCQAYNAASAVFIGHVTDVKLAEGSEWANIKYPPGTAYLRVEQAFKGIEESDVVFPQGTGGDCIPVFAKDQRWLIYASRDSKTQQLRPIRCSRNSTVEHAADDLSYLRNLSVLASKTRLAGTIKHYDDIPGKGFQFISNLAGTKVSITDEKGRGYEAFSDSNGVWEVIGLPAGTYKVHAEIPNNLKLVEWQKNDESVELKSGSCAAADFTARSDAGISGRVIDSDGRAVPYIFVNLIRADMIESIGQQGVGRWEYTDKEGKYKFKEVPPGKYLLGVNLDGEPVGAYPYPRTFYPGVDSAARAAVIELGDLQKVSDYDIHLLPRLTTKAVKGIVLWSDGQPVTGGSVSLKNTDNLEDMKIGYADAPIDKKGNFSLTVLDGTTGWLHAYDHSERLRNVRGMHYATPISIEVNRDIENIKLIIPLPENVQKEPQSVKRVRQ